MLGRTQRCFTLDLLNVAQKWDETCGGTMVAVICPRRLDSVYFSIIDFACKKIRICTWFKITPLRSQYYSMDFSPCRIYEWAVKWDVPSNPKQCCNLTFRKAPISSISFQNVVLIGLTESAVWGGDSSCRSYLLYGTSVVCGNNSCIMLTPVLPSVKKASSWKSETRTMPVSIFKDENKSSAHIPPC